VTQDFEGDQFTFFKFLPEDLETLFGLGVQELAVYDGIEAQIAEQLRRDRLPLVEIDSFYLPDTQATAYRREHVKTTIGAVELDAPARRLGYFHNTGYHLVEGEDFDGLFHRLPHQAANPDLMFPYAEFVKRRRPPLEGSDLTEASVRLLRQHLARRPERNPVSAYRAEFGRHIETLASRPMSYFHLYCFNTARQLGANFELLGSHLRWLDERAGLGLEDLAAGATRIAADAKVLQFQLARSVKRARLDDCGPALAQPQLRQRREAAQAKRLPPARLQVQAVPKIPVVERRRALQAPGAGGAKGGGNGARHDGRQPSGAARQLPWARHGSGLGAEKLPARIHGHDALAGDGDDPGHH
jgi:hypothetical protein